MKAFADRHRSLPVIKLDSGALLSPRAADEALINQVLLTSLKAFSVDAIGLSTEDLYYFFPPPGQADRPRLQPPFVSANIIFDSPGRHELKPYLLKTVTAETPSGPQSFRLGITGVADAGRGLSLMGVSVSDPEPAARRVVRDLRPLCDLLVLLTDLPQPLAAQLASRVEGIDIIIDGEKNAFPGAPQRVNETFIFGASAQGRYLGEIKVYLNENKTAARYKARYIGLDSGIPDEPKLGALADDTRKTVAELHKKLAAAPITRPAAPIYAGSASCMNCHAPAHAAWSRSTHARAMDILKTKGQDFNPQCVRCHSTGFGIEGGFLNILQTPGLANVHCESCHGPALAHSKNPSLRLSRRTQESCNACHTSIDSPNFDFAKAWNQIKH